MFFSTCDLLLVLKCPCFAHVSASLLDSPAGGPGFKGHHEAGGFSRDGSPSLGASAYICIYHSDTFNFTCLDFSYYNKTATPLNLPLWLSASNLTGAFKPGWFKIQPITRLFLASPRWRRAKLTSAINHSCSACILKECWTCSFVVTTQASLKNTFLARQAGRQAGSHKESKGHLRAQS